MKLNPVVASFQTSEGDPGADMAAATPPCTILPTPCAQCLVCDG